MLRIAATLSHKGRGKKKKKKNREQAQ